MRSLTHKRCRVYELSVPSPYEMELSVCEVGASSPTSPSANMKQIFSKTPRHHVSLRARDALSTLTILVRDHPRHTFARAEHFVCPKKRSDVRQVEEAIIKNACRRRN